MNYNPKSKPGLFHWLADPVKILMGGGLLTIIGVLVFFFTESVSPPPPRNVPVINTGLSFIHSTESAAAPQIAVPVVDDNPEDPTIPIEEFAVGKPFANHHSSKRFEIFDCPAYPPANYPVQYSMLKIIENWNPDNTEIPPLHYDSLCHFDFKNKTQLQYAYNYRDAELPFVVHNMPEINKVVKKWNTEGYLKSFLGNKRYRTETSTNNHFMYWNQASAAFKKTALGKMWKAPTGVTQITYSEWLKGALANHNKTIDSRVHQYFRVSSNHESELLFQELPFFKPRKSLYIVDPKGQRGIHCRFGMRSVIAEAHFDSGRNSIVLFGGMRRYILTHPNQCTNMHMLPKKHPSGRHSDVDWSKPDLEKFPNFKKLVGHEVIMAAGDFMYLPQDWIHFIVSLTINFQCNTRSGFCNKYHHFITDCGF